jgi:hypothetical protein
MLFGDFVQVSLIGDSVLNTKSEYSDSSEAVFFVPSIFPSSLPSEFGRHAIQSFKKPFCLFESLGTIQIRLSLLVACGKM